MNKKALYENIMQDVAKIVKRHLNETFDDPDSHYEAGEYDDNDFLDALIHYGELEHDEIMQFTGGDPIIIDGNELDSIYWSQLGDSEYLVYSYKDPKTGSSYEKELSLDDIPGDVVDSIYEYLQDNEDPNVDYFNSLPQDDYDEDEDFEDDEDDDF